MLPLRRAQRTVAAAASCQALLEEEEEEEALSRQRSLCGTLWCSSRGSSSSCRPSPQGALLLAASLALPLPPLLLEGREEQEEACCSLT